MRNKKIKSLVLAAELVEGMLHPHTPGSLDMGGQDQLVVVGRQGQAGCLWGTHLRGEELMPHLNPVPDCTLVEGRRG